MYMQNKNKHAATSVAKPFVSKINPKPDQIQFKTTSLYVEELRRYEKIERLAAIEHDQWCFWSQRIMPEFDELITTISTMDNYLMTVDKNYLQSATHQLARKMFDKFNERNDRWTKLWCAYTGLSEEMKEHDRIWAKKSYEAMNR
jgi:agmatine/peptidylarginine deiminase